MMWKPGVSLVLAACLALAPQASAVPTVKVGMNAAFDAGPYLLELVYGAAALCERVFEC